MVVLNESTFKINNGFIYLFIVSLVEMNTEVIFSMINECDTVRRLAGCTSGSKLDGRSVIIL